ALADAKSAGEIAAALAAEAQTRDCTPDPERAVATELKLLIDAEETARLRRVAGAMLNGEEMSIEDGQGLPYTNPQTGVKSACSSMGRDLAGRYTVLAERTLDRIDLALVSARACDSQYAPIRPENMQFETQDILEHMKTSLSQTKTYLQK